MNLNKYLSECQKLQRRNQPIDLQICTIREHQNWDIEVILTGKDASTLCVAHFYHFWSERRNKEELEKLIKAINEYQR